jgi:hypothetical protein
LLLRTEREKGMRWGSVGVIVTCVAFLLEVEKETKWLGSKKDNIEIARCAFAFDW